MSVDLIYTLSNICVIITMQNITDKNIKQYGQRFFTREIMLIMKEFILQKTLIASTKAVDYYTVSESGCAASRYGVMLVSKTDSDKASTEGIFFTRDEAAKCCEFLAENEVYPVSLGDILHNIYFF